MEPSNKIPSWQYAKLRPLDSRFQLYASLLTYERPVAWGNWRVEIWEGTRQIKEMSFFDVPEA